MLALVTDDTSITLWDFRNNTTIHTLLGYMPHDDVSFLPDGAILATGSSTRLRLWSVLSGYELYFPNKYSGTCKVANGIDNSFLVGASQNGIIRMWDEHTERLCSIRRNAYASSAAFPFNGQYLAFGLEGGSVQLYDFTSALAEPLELIGHTGRVMSVAFSPDGHLLASASQDHSIILWDVATGQALRTLTTHYGAVNSIVFSPDGRMLASASSDGTVHVWGIP
jgi:WD40 repeat protein